MIKLERSVSHRFVGQSGPARPVTFKNPEFLFSYASVAGMSEAGSEAGTKASGQASVLTSSGTEVNWARVDGAYKRVLAFFESPNRDLMSLDYDFLSVLTKAYADILAFHGVNAKRCENEAFYYGFLAYTAEVFNEAYHILAEQQTRRIWAYMDLLEDLEKAFKKVQDVCLKIYPRFQEL